MQVTITPEDANRLRLVLERGIQALGSPDASIEAAKRQKELSKRLAPREEKQEQQDSTAV